MQELNGGQINDNTPVPVPVPLWTKNNQPISTNDIPQLTLEEWHDGCVQLCKAGSRIVALFVLPKEIDNEPYRLVAVFANDSRGQVGLVQSTVAPGGSFPSLTRQVPQAQAFERDLFERTGIYPEGHPWLKPLRRHAELEKASNSRNHEFYRVAGEDIHEVAVGPVHAGIIEPGHFRFQCHGETVLSLEIQLGYQQRGAE